MTRRKTIPPKAIVGKAILKTVRPKTKDYFDDPILMTSGPEYIAKDGELSESFVDSPIVSERDSKNTEIGGLVSSDVEKNQLKSFEKAAQGQKL